MASNTNEEITTIAMRPSSEGSQPPVLTQERRPVAASMATYNFLQDSGLLTGLELVTLGLGMMCPGEHCASTLSTLSLLACSRVSSPSTYLRGPRPITAEY